MKRNGHFDYGVLCGDDWSEWFVFFFDIRTVELSVFLIFSLAKNVYHFCIKYLHFPINIGSWSCVIGCYRIIFVLFSWVIFGSDADSLNWKHQNHCCRRRCILKIQTRASGKNQVINLEEPELAEASRKP